MTAFVPTTLDLLLQTVVTLLTNATDAQGRVYSPRDWSTRKQQYPAILVEVARERKESLSRNTAPEFTTVGTLLIAARVTAPAGASDSGAVVARAAAWRLKRQIEVALVNATPLMLLIQQFPSIEAEVKASAEGEQHIGELKIALGLEWYEGAESFAPPSTDALERITIVVDAQNCFDPTGAYVPDFPYPVPPAPRTVGPDGRAEGRLDITLPS